MLAGGKKEDSSKDTKAGRSKESRFDAQTPEKKIPSLMSLPTVSMTEASQATLQQMQQPLQTVQQQVCIAISSFDSLLGKHDIVLLLLHSICAKVCTVSFVFHSS